VKAIAPALEDVMVSKLARLDDKDRTFVEACHRERPFDLRLIERRVSETPLDPAIAKRAIDYVRKLAADG